MTVSSIIQLSPEGEVNSGEYRDAKHWVHRVQFTDPEGDSCFSIDQISWMQMKKFNNSL